MHKKSREEIEAEAREYFGETFQVEFTDTLDLHTLLPRDMKNVVKEFLENARVKKYRVVRIIHGKGIGVQRENVRQILAQTPFVEDFSDAPTNLGATIAHLKISES